MRIYDVLYREEGKQQLEAVEANNPGHAFAKLLRKHPQAQLLKCETQSRVARSDFWISYDPPPVQRVPLVRAKKESNIQGEFPGI